MNIRPILFSGPKIRAILDGRMTMTRRVFKVGPAFAHLLPPGKLGLTDAETRMRVEDGQARWVRADMRDCLGLPLDVNWKCPYGQPGDRLWVRETWRPYVEITKDRCGVIFAADNAKCENKAAGLFWRMDRVSKWRPSIHMPRWASRLTLEIVSVRVERLNEISPEDALAEGVYEHPTWPGNYAASKETCDQPLHEAPSEAFRELWNSINAARGFGWDTNCWCWVVEFKRVDQEAAS